MVRETYIPTIDDMVTNVMNCAEIDAEKKIELFHQFFKDINNEDFEYQGSSIELLDWDWLKDHPDLVERLYNGEDPVTDKSLTTITYNLRDCLHKALVTITAEDDEIKIKYEDRFNSISSKIYLDIFSSIGWGDKDDLFNQLKSVLGEQATCLERTVKI